jgi:uncharacterized membrane protein
MLPRARTGSARLRRGRSVIARAILALLSVGVAGYALVAYGLLPLGVLLHPDMQATYRAHPLGIYLHVFAASTALLLGPFQFSAHLRVRHPGLHRLSGRIYLLAGVLLGGLAGLYMSALAYGGPPARLGFALLALAWLYTGLRAYLAVRARELAAHRRWMVRNFALAFAAVTLRLWLPAFMASGMDFAIAYPLVAWLCWVPNLLFAQWLLRQRDDRAAGP